METDNLILESDGDVFLKLPPDADGDRDIKRLGFIDDCRWKVPADADDEFDELLQAWSEMQREANGYYNDVMSTWDRAKGF